MQILYIVLILLYATIPPISLFYSLRLIYQENNKYGWDFHYFFTYLITLSFLPLLFFPQINLGLTPKSSLSVFLLISTFCFALLGIKQAIKQKILISYLGGTYAAFMEEILYRGIIFGLVNAFLHTTWITIIVTAVTFGLWHFHNYPQRGMKFVTFQFLYTTFLGGTIFAFARIVTGDIYLAILCHYIINATTFLGPNWMRVWIKHIGKKDWIRD